MADKSQSKSQPFSMWQGLNLPNWLRLLAMRPPMDWRHTGRILSISLGSVSNSLFELIDSALYSRSVSKKDVPAPVFIIGFWRSGTTLLHNLLSLDEQFASPNGYQVAFPGHFLLTENIIGPLVAPLFPKTRPMDEVPVTWDSPQEDEIALAVKSLLSPYIQTAFHNHDHLWHDYLDFRSVPESVRDRWKRVFMWYLQRLTARFPNRRLLLKSPTHTYRIAILQELFPDAKFVYIVRNPYRVFQSAMHLRKTIYTENGLATPVDKGWESSVLGLMELGYESVQRDRAKLGPNQFHEIRLEDLELDILGELKSVYDHLGIGGFDQLAARVEPQLDALQKHKKNQFQPDEALLQKVYGRMRTMFERYDYPSGLPTTEPSPSSPLPPSGGPSPSHLPMSAAVRVA